MKSQPLLEPSWLAEEPADPEKRPWKKVDCEIKDHRGRVYFSQKAVEAPAEWSQLAVEIAAAKYFRKSGVGSKGRETSVRQLVRRVTEQIARAGREQKYFRTSKEASRFEKVLRGLLLDQKGLFNSPVWFNYGLHQAYGIQGDATCFRWNEKLRRVEKLDENFRHPQVSACFIQKIDDNLESIFELVKNEARLFKYGSGSGTNFSSLRGRDEKLQGGSTSSGLISFLEVFDRGAGAIKSGGTTRRAAKMVILDVDHPEIQDFIHWKVSEEKKAKILAANGYGGDFESEAYRTVAGQNANNSVRVTDAFMRAVARDQDWSLRARLTGKPIETLKARELWGEIAEAAWQCADPGVQFHDTVNAWHTCPAGGEIRASNPCSEYMFLDDSACNLASLNLLKFVRADGSFDVADFVRAIQVFFWAQEILVDDASYPTAMIAQNSHDYRPLGLGLAGLGAFLMQRGIAYDSEAGRAWGAGLMALVTGAAYEWSAQMASRRGAFTGYKKNKKAMKSVLTQHQRALKRVGWSHLPPELKSETLQRWQSALALGDQHGYRNAQASVVAPTGTIGLVMDSETTGIEPEFSLLKKKKLSGGGELRILSQAFLVALEKLGYAPEVIEQIRLFVEMNGSLRECPQVRSEHRMIFATAMEISPMGHLEMMAALQPFVSGAISKTVNLPRSATPEQIGEIYQMAWTKKLKSIAIYRDGSKGAQPLQTLKQDPGLPKCFECGSPTELAGGCFRCTNCGTVLGCS